MNQTLQVIANRYSCRDYKDEMPSDMLLQAIAKAAVQSPSAVNRQPWRVIVVKDRQLIEEMESEALTVLEKMEDRAGYNRIMERGGKLFYGAPCMIMVPIDSEQSSAVLDCGIVCQNISLAATSLGIANVICGLTGLAFTDPRRTEDFSKRLGFPEGYAFGCSVLLGYANTEREPHAPDEDKISFIE